MKSSNIQVERILLVRRGHVSDNSWYVEDGHLEQLILEFCTLVRILQYYANTALGIYNKIVEQ